MNIERRRSRPEKCAAGIGDAAPGHHQFVDERVLLTGEAGVLASQNGRHCFRNSLLLLVRTHRNVSVWLPAGCEQLLSECREVADRVCFDGEVEFARTKPEYSQFSAVLSVGTKVEPSLPWTVVNANGWLARVSSGRTSISADCGQFNPIAALAAACFGVAETFKRTIRLKESRGRLLDGMSFSLRTYSYGNDPGPALPRSLCVDMLLVGLGAIGNGVLHLLSELPVVGVVRFVDLQSFEEENLGTCLLIGPSNVGDSKAEFAAERLSRKIDARAYEMKIEDFASNVANLGETYPRQILCALDNIVARHAAQNLWPDLLIDGAIGDFPCQVSSWSWESPSACLQCIFESPKTSASMMASRATGLHPVRAMDGESRVSEADVASAPPEKAQWLRTRVGRRVCSVVQEGIAAEISTKVQHASFAPSVPFVACMSACMMVAELVSHVACWDTELKTRFQFDLLQGPEYGEMYAEDCHTDCFRVGRKSIIERHRAQRSVLAVH
jgi:molybdopterin/thiamine biosynthesis adenylyltransferase